MIYIKIKNLTSFLNLKCKRNSFVEEFMFYNIILHYLLQGFSINPPPLYSSVLLTFTSGSLRDLHEISVCVNVTSNTYKLQHN